MQLKKCSRKLNIIYNNIHPLSIIYDINTRKDIYIEACKEQHEIDIDKAVEVIHNMMVDGVDFNLDNNGNIMKEFRQAMNESHDYYPRKWRMICGEYI